MLSNIPVLCKCLRIIVSQVNMNFAPFANFTDHIEGFIENLDLPYCHVIQPLARLASRRVF